MISLRCERCVYINIFSRIGFMILTFQRRFFFKLLKIFTSKCTQLLLETTGMKLPLNFLHELLLSLCNNPFFLNFWPKISFFFLVGGGAETDVWAFYPWAAGLPPWLNLWRPDAGWGLGSTCNEVAKSRLYWSVLSPDWPGKRHHSHCVPQVYLFLPIKVDR